MHSHSFFQDVNRAARFSRRIDPKSANLWHWVPPLEVFLRTIRQRARFAFDRRYSDARACHEAAGAVRGKIPPSLALIIRGAGPRATPRSAIDRAGAFGFPRAAQQEEMSVAARRSCRMTTFRSAPTASRLIPV